MDKKSIELEKANLLRDYRETFTTRSGQAVLFDLVKRCGIMENRFHPESDRVDCYERGRASVGHEILELINYATINGYFELKQEQVKQHLAKNSIVSKYFPGERNAR